MRTSVKNGSESTWVCVFVLFVCAKRSQDAQTLPWSQFNIYKICIWTTYLYTLYNNWRQNYSFYKKRSAQWHSKWQCKLWNQLTPNISILFPSGQYAFPIQSWSTVSCLSLFFSLVLILIDILLIFTFFTFSFSAPFIQYSVSGLGISFFLTCRYCFRALVPLFSLVWVGWEPEEVFGLHATGMCHSCIVSACEHTNIIDDILLMAFWYVTVMFSQDNKEER